MQPPLGSLFISRNTNEADNTSPGYWNHLAIWLGNGQIGESQVGQGTIVTPLDDYLARPYTYGVLIPRQKYLIAGEMAAGIAKRLIGKRYGKLSSYRPRQQTNRMNCVTYAYGVPWRMSLRQLFPGERFGNVRIPDDVYETGVFRL